MEQSAYLLHVKECSNVMPLYNYFKAQDKFRLSHANGECVRFVLCRQAFRTGINFNDMLSDKDSDEIPLTASPCSHLTVPVSQRLTVCRTCMYTISHLHELVLTTCMLCMDAARDSTRRLVFLFLPSLSRIRSHGISFPICSCGRGSALWRCLRF